MVVNVLITTVIATMERHWPSWPWSITVSLAIPILYPIVVIEKAYKSKDAQIEKWKEMLQRYGTHKRKPLRPSSTDKLKEVP